MAIDTWLLFAAASVLLSLTPGPSGLLALSHGGRFGVTRTFATVTGATVGFAVLLGAAVSGLGAVLLASKGVLDAVRIAGAVYLIWLGIGLWRSDRVVSAASSGSTRVRAAGSLFAEGLLVALSNPKVILFFAAFLPQFLDPDGSLLLQFAVMAGTFLAGEFLIEMALAVGSERILPWLAHGARARWFDRLTGGLFVAAGAALLAWQQH